MPLPQDTSGGLGGGDYFKLVQGNNKILILADAIDGYEYWTNEDKPVRSKEKFAEPLVDAKVRTVKEKDKATGEEKEVEKPDKQRYFWAVPVYNYNTNSVEIFQITQKGIRDELAAIQSNDDWGDPVGNYTVTINKSGEGLSTRYKVTPNPATDAAKKDIEKHMKAYEESPVAVEAAFFG